MPRRDFTVPDASSHRRGLSIAWGRWIRRGHALVVLMAVSLAAIGREEATIDPRRTSGITAGFSAAVNWDFNRLQKLDAWQNSALILRKTLAQWYPSRTDGLAVENGGRETLHGFFTRLAKTGPEDWSVVCLASHQSRDGLWQFPHDSPQSWAEIFSDTTTRPNPARFVVIDACYAEAADSTVVMRGTGASGVLYASNRTEEVHELNFDRRFPIDLARRYPAEAKWLHDSLGPAWNGRTSFLGFIWLRAFLATPRAPRNIEDWHQFFGLCERLARDFRGGRGSTLATTVRFVVPPGAGVP